MEIKLLKFRNHSTPTYKLKKEDILNLKNINHVMLM